MSLFKRLYNVARSQIGDSKQQSSPPSDFDIGFDQEPEGHVATSAPTVADRYYANLELAPGASYSEIKTAYRNLLRRYHPDRHSADPEKSRLAEEISKGLNEAMNYFDKEHQEGRL